MGQSEGQTKVKDIGGQICFQLESFINTDIILSIAA